MRNVRKISKKYYLRQIVAFVLVYFMFFNPALVYATSNPVQVAGDSITGVNGAGTDLTEVLMGDSSRAVINWDSLDTLSNQELHFLKTTGNFAVLNRVIAGGATQFDGSLFGNQGDIFIINTRGIVFGPESYIQARNFVASGIDMSNNDFMSPDGQFAFQRYSSGYPNHELIGNVTNEGIGTDHGIHAEQVALIGQNVYNKGLISAPGGAVVMAAGETVYLNEFGGNVSVQVIADPRYNSYDVDNGGDNGGGPGTGPGTIEATDGKVILAAGDIWSTAIEGVESLRAEAKRNITLEGAVDADGDVSLLADSDLWDGGDFIANDTITGGGNVDITGNFVELNGDVIAQDGDLTITGRTSSEDWYWEEAFELEDGWWGHIEVAPETMLLAGDDVVLKDAYGSGGYYEPPAGEMDLFGHGALTIAALGGSIQTQGPFGEGVKITVEDLSPAELIMVQADPLNLADYSFGNQNNTDLVLQSINGSVTAVDSSQPLSGKNENAADQWASITAYANTDITLQGHDASRDIKAGILTSFASGFDTGNITVTSDNSQVLLTGNVSAQQGSVAVTAIDPTNGGIVSSGDITASDGITLFGEVTANGEGDQTFDAGEGTLWAKDTLSTITKITPGSLTLGGDTLVNLDGIEDSVWVQAGPLTIEDSLDAEGNLKAQGIIHLQGMTNNVAGDILSTGSGIIFDHDVIADGVGSQLFDAGSGKLIAEDGADIDKSTAGSLTLAGLDGLELGGNVTGTGMTSVDKLTFKNNVNAHGTGDAQDQRFDAGLGALDADGSIAKTETGKLNLGGDEGIELGGNVETYDGDLTFEDAVTANGGNQILDADGAGKDLIADDDIIKTTAGSLTLGAGTQPDAEIALAGDVKTTDGDLIFWDKVIANGSGNQVFDADGTGTDLIADDDIIKTTAGNLTLGAGTQPDAGIELAGDVATTDGDLTLWDQVIANDTGDTKDQRLDAVGGKLWATDAITKTTTGNLNLGGDDAIDLDGTVDVQMGSLTIEDDFSTAADLIASQNVTLDGTATLDGSVSQKIEATNGSLYANDWVHKTGTGNLDMFGGFEGPWSTAYSVWTNEVRVEEGELSIRGDGSVTMRGSVYSTGNMLLSANDDEDTDTGILHHYATTGTIESRDGQIDMSATGSEINLYGGPSMPEAYVSAGDDILLRDNTKINGNRKIIAGDDVVLAGGMDITNNGSGDLTIEAGDDILLGIDDVDSHWINQDVGSAGNVTADGDLTLKAVDDVYAHGDLTATGDITVSSSDSTTYLLGDKVEATGSVNLQNNTVAADGILIKAVNGDVVVGVETETVNPADYPGIPGLLPGVYTETDLKGNGALTVEAGSDIIVGGDLDTDGSMVVTAGDNISLGNAYADGDMDMTATNGNITVGNLKRVYDLEPQAMNVGLDELDGDLVYFGGEVDTYDGDMTLTAANGDISFKSAYSSGNMDMDAGGDITAGVIAPAVYAWGPLDEVVTITQGGSIDAYGDITLLAGNDIKGKWINWGGDTGSVYLDAGNDILFGGVFPTLVANVYTSDGDNTWSQRFGTTQADVLNVYKGGGIFADGDLTLLAGNDIKLKTAQTWGGDILMDAGRDILVGGTNPHAVELTEGYGTAEFDKGGLLYASNGAITLDAGCDISLKMARAEDDITMTAGDNITLRTNQVNPGDDAYRDATESWSGDIRLHALNGDISIAEGYELIAGELYYGEGTSGGGVLLKADNGKIYSPGGDDDTLNIYVEGSSSQFHDIGVELPGDPEKKAAIVIISKEDLKLGPDSQLIAYGYYLPLHAIDLDGIDSFEELDSYWDELYDQFGDVIYDLKDGFDDYLYGLEVEPEDFAAYKELLGDYLAGLDDRPAIGLLADPSTAIGGIIRNEGNPIDVAVYLQSKTGDVDVESQLISVNYDGTMVVDAYDTVTLGDLTSEPAIQIPDSIGVPEGRFWEIDRLEVVSRITEWLFQASDNGTLPYPYNPGIVEAFIGGEYVLRGAGLDNPDIFDGRAWVLEDPLDPAPLYEEAGEAAEKEEFGEGGCPALMDWLADEISVPAEDIQVAVAGAYALSTDVQPCEMCARLMEASNILQDVEGTQIASLARVVNEFVTAAAPPSPEQMTSIAAAVAEHVDDGTHYAAAGEWIDALVAYVGIMKTEMGYSATDAAAFAEKYLTRVNDSGNAALIAYVQARLAAIGG